MFSLILAPVAAAMLFEYFSERNLFAILSGVPDGVEIRSDRPRCQGAFGHPILAGTFGAALIPLFIGLWVKRVRDRWMAVTGLISATIMTLTAGSGGAILTYVSGILAICLWPMRHKMRSVRWLILSGLFLLQVVMNAPVWYIMGRVSRITGGEGFYRAELISQAINHLDEWWLIGTKYTAHWMPFALPNYQHMSDMTNQYLSEGVNGGLIRIILFVAIIVLSFREVGIALQENENDFWEGNAIIWSMGATLYAHTISYWGVSYFDQSRVVWFLFLAMISCIASANKRRRVSLESL
jgi:hypothetical protein